MFQHPFFKIQENQNGLTVSFPPPLDPDGFLAVVGVILSVAILVGSVVIKFL